MKRRLVTLAASASLLLFAGAAALWPISYFRTYSLRYSTLAFDCLLLADKGLVEIDIVLGDTSDRGLAWNDFERAATWGREELNTFGPPNPATRLGFGTHAYRLRVGFLAPALPGRVVFLPLWLVCAVAAIMPLASYRGGRKRRKGQSENRCAACGYDLRATPHRCPECGAVPPATAAPAVKRLTSPSR